jgi:hypothetical protein
MNLQKNKTARGTRDPIVDDPKITLAEVLEKFKNGRSKLLRECVTEITRIWDFDEATFNEEITRQTKGRSASASAESSCLFTPTQRKQLIRLHTQMTKEKKIQQIMVNMALLLIKQVCEHVLPVLLAAMLFLLYNKYIHQTNNYRVIDFQRMTREYLIAHHFCNNWKNDDIQ